MPLPLSQLLAALLGLMFNIKLVIYTLDCYNTVHTQYCLTLAINRSVNA